MNNSKKIGLHSCIGIIVSGCIGSAIFSLSGLTIYYAGAACIISWILAAIIQGVYGTQVSELSLYYGKSGGIYVFPSLTLGRFYGFLASWGFIIANIIAVGFSAIYIGKYLSISFDIFKGQQTTLAIAAILFCAILNMLNIKDMGRFNSILLYALIALMIGYSTFALFSPNFNLSNFQPFFYGAKGKTGFINAVPIALVAYGNVVSVAFIAEDVDNPKKNIILSLVVGLGIVTALYVLMLASTLGHISYQDLKTNPDMRFIPMFAACFFSMKNLPYLPSCISIAAVLALLTTMLVLGYLASVTIQRMAEDGIFPKLIRKKNKNDAPIAAIIVNTFLVALLSCFPSYVEFFTNLGSLISVIIMIIVIYSFIVFKRKNASGGKKYVAGVIGYITIAVMLLCYFPEIFSAGWQMWIFTIVVYLAGILIYCIPKLFKKNAL